MESDYKNSFSNEKEKEVFLALLDCVTDKEKSDILDREYGSDDQLKERALRLVDLHETPDSLLDLTEHDDRRLALAGNDSHETINGSVGEKVGLYTLSELLGTGGFGSVWRAKQERPVRRKVALKLLRKGMDSADILARFDQERQALAVMDHPDIARVYDAGVAESGSPYFVMELAEDGRSITRYCTEENLPLRRRLELFLRVCDAVQHAHQKQILHRDIKPGNILVSGEAGAERVKVIDFGVSKAMGDDRLADLTVVTKKHQVLGTPKYMSPEQLSGESDVDTRSDVYSLGILLYELISGTTPFAQEESTSQSPESWSLMIREQIPRKPSTRLNGKGEASDREIVRQVKGDLDSIALKSIEPDRDRRYSSPDALAEDISRFLENKPVSARPHSRVYLATRFVKRNKGAVAATCAVLAVLLAGLASTSLFFLKEKEAAEIARKEAERSRMVSEILTNTLQSAGVSFSLGRDSTMLRDILEETANGLGEELAAYPGIEAEIRNLLGNTFEDIDEYEKAVEQLERAAAVLENGNRTVGPADRLLHVRILNDLAEAYQSIGDQKRAEEYIRKVLELQKEAPYETPLERDIAKYEASSLLGWIMFRDGRGEEAEDMMREAYEFWLKYPAEAPLSEIPKTYGTLLARIGKPYEGIAVIRTELEKFREHFGPYHPLICNCLSNLANLVKRDDPEEAEALYLESLEQGDFLFGDRSPHADHALGGLAGIAARRGDFAEELRLRQEAFDAAARVFPEKHPYRFAPVPGLVDALLRAAEKKLRSGDRTEAENFLRRLETLMKSEPRARPDPERFAAVQETLGPPEPRGESSESVQSR